MLKVVVFLILWAVKLQTSEMYNLVSDSDSGLTKIMEAMELI